jgi:hypothetical protein
MLDVHYRADHLCDVKLVTGFAAFVLWVRRRSPKSGMRG